MFQSIPTPSNSLKALYGVRSEDLFELRESMRDILQRVRETQELCYAPIPDAKPGSSASVCVFPEHSGLLCFIMDELEQFIGDEENGGV